ncbi:dynein regulatory complex subunit 2 [Microplitis mediator]|uniref:dynein regulatory complex subunit 2 n=1 Tax=Microplitis mediator TaxID=375433 RepID=UPI002553967A|nr:dynein regulatory complex subunit 2 [Microplitis mediator]
MPPKKKSKGSKLAKMSEEERLRYLQHRAEIELEAKRRKQQLIAGFTKNKLKREEAFSRLNTAKINEQWRFKLRQFKCRELYDEVEYLWKNFDETLRSKNAVINRLYEELENADVYHRRLQEVHMQMIDKLINSNRKRLEGLHANYIKSVMLIKVGELNEMADAKGELIDSCKHLETIIYAENCFINERLMETKTRNAINTYNVEFTKAEAIGEIKRTTGSKITELWSKFKKVIASYQNATADRRKQYENLKKFDENHKNEAASFPQLQNFLTSTIDNLKYQENLLTETRNKSIKDLEGKMETLNARVWKLRDKIGVHQTVDKIQLKRLSLISGKVIEELKTLEEKSNSVATLVSMCSSLEPLASKYGPLIEEPDDVSVDSGIVTDSMIGPYQLLDNFWRAFNTVKAENFIRKKQYSQAVAENNKLKRYLRSYFGAVTRGTAKLLD